MSTRQKRLVLVLTAVIALTRLVAVSRSLFDWDEALFTLAVREYDVTRHHPHPPGYPLFVAAAKAVHLAGAGEFRALQIVVLLGACAVFPAVFFFARALGFDFATSLGGAAIFSFLPNVWVYGGTGFSDVPGVAIGLTACALLLHGRTSTRACLLGAILLGVAAGIRPTNLLLGFVPALLATAAQWRRARLAVAGAIAAGAVIVGASYAGAALASASTEGYLFYIRQQSRYVQEVDSWRNPGRPPLGEVARTFFLRPVRQHQQMNGLALLAGLSLAAAAWRRRREPWTTLAVFAPMMIAAWLNLDVATAARYAVSYMALHALLAADALRQLTRGRSALHAAACTVVVGVFAVWTWPAVRLQSSSAAPPFAALDWVARHVDRGTPVYVPSGLGPASQAVLPEHRVVWYDELGDVSALPAESWIVDFSVDADAVNFSWPRSNPLWDVVRRRWFEVSVSRSAGVLLFRDGWYEEEIDGEYTFRWMGGESKTTLPALHARGRLAMRITVPLDALPQPPDVEVLVNGKLLERFTAFEPVMDKFWITAAWDAPVELTIRTSATANLQRMGLSRDGRDLGLRVDALSWTPVR